MLVVLDNMLSLGEKLFEQNAAVIPTTDFLNQLVGLYVLSVCFAVKFAVKVRLLRIQIHLIDPICCSLITRGNNNSSFKTKYRCCSVFWFFHHLLRESFKTKQHPLLSKVFAIKIQWHLSSIYVYVLIFLNVLFWEVLTELVKVALIKLVAAVFLLFFFPLAEYAESIGDGKSDEFKEAERKRIMDLLENFWYHTQTNNNNYYIYILLYI